MPTNVLMPALSPTMEKGNLARWVKHEGDEVKAGDVIAEIETDKATMEVEAVDEGTLAKILVPEGTADVPVNQPIAVIAAAGEDVNAAAAAPVKGAKKLGVSSVETPAAQTPQAEGKQGSAPRQAQAQQAQAQQTQAQARVQSQPRAEEGTRAAQQAQDGAKAAEQARPRPEEGAKAPVSKNGPQALGQIDRIFASPLARRLAREAGIELNRIAGSGPHGRVVARDIEQAKAGKGLRVPGPAPAAPGAPTPAIAPALSDQQVRALFEEGSYELVPHDNMRRTIAQRMATAAQTIPHFYLTMDCDIGKLLAAREEINAAAPKDDDGKPAYKLSVNDFVVKALALALQRIPDANVSWTEAGMLKHKHSDIGVAVAMPHGLITPIVRNTETKSLSAISNEMRDLAKRARDRKLKPHEYQGGTSAVSNLGMYGIKDFTAVINPPHATILAVGAGEERAVVRNGKIEIAQMMSVTMSCDHRAVDGALGAELLGAFKRLIENPVMMVV